MKQTEIAKKAKAFLSSTVATVECCGKTKQITGFCVTVTVLIVLLHVCMIKRAGCKIGKLKEKAKQESKNSEQTEQ